MTTSISSSDKDIVVLLEITYGTSSVLRFNDTQETLDLPGMGTFLSVPSLAINLPPYSGIFERKEIEVEFAFLDRAFLFGVAISNGRAFSPARMRAWQWIRSPGSDRMRKLFDARITSAVRNPGGRSDILKLTAVSAKSDLKRACGIVSGNTCQWTFGDSKTCGVNLAALDEAGSITVISKNQVTITGLAAHNDNYWNKGYIEADGVRVRIREWVSGTTFILSKLVPKDWEDTVTGFGSKSVTVIPGCDQRKETCEFTWNNLANMIPIGYAIPARNPFFEDDS